MKGFAQRAVQHTRRCGHLHSPPGILRGGGDEREEGSEIFTEDQIKAFEAFKDTSLANTRSSDLFKSQNSDIDKSLKKSAKKRRIYNSLSQQGITLEELQMAYRDAFDRGFNDMLDFRLGFFYSATAIAIFQHFKTSPEKLAEIMKTLDDILADEENYKEQVEECLRVTGVDTSSFESVGEDAKTGRSVIRSTASRKDLAAINRMQKTGISQKDLEYERDLGYNNGWNSEFHYSACYSALALALHSIFKCGAEEIESVFVLAQEIGDEEITVADIYERCRTETGVDVSQMASATA